MRKLTRFFTDMISNLLFLSFFSALEVLAIFSSNGLCPLHLAVPYEGPGIILP